MAFIPAAGLFLGPMFGAGDDDDIEENDLYTDTNTAIVGGTSINLIPRLLFLSIGVGANWVEIGKYDKDGEAYRYIARRQGILEVGLNFYPTRWLYLLGTYRLIGFKEHGFTVGLGFAWKKDFWESF